MFKIPDELLSVLKIMFYIAGSVGFLAFFIACTISIDTSNILEICYCPQCGFDLRG